ncbi:MAG: NADH-quinone oxidoreductase subunit C [Verrucomicrobiota bacterium]
METLEQIQQRIEAAVPGARLEIVPNDSPSGQRSLLVDCGHALPVAAFLQTDPLLRFDYVSNVTGIDWPDLVLKEKVRVRKLIDGAEKEVEETVERTRPGYLEAVYHLFSMALKHGPLIVRLRTVDRGHQNHLPSLTPLWRGAEFQEREVYDLFGIVFDGHPDLRRILLWDGFQDHPMRKDYTEPDDYEWEPTAHDEVLARAKQHRPTEAKA